MPSQGKSYKLFQAVVAVLVLPLISIGSFALGAALQQGAPGNGMSPVQTGYAVVTPSTATNDLVVFATFGERRGTDTTQAGVLPSTLSKHSMLFVSTSGRLSKNLGVAIANPDPALVANVTLTLRDDKGAVLASAPVVVDPLHQAAQFVTQLFSNQQSVPQDLTGTLDISSDIPVAVIGLRFRGVNFSTLPATNLSAPIGLPVISANVGGPGAVVLAQFAAGGGWATEIVLANSGTANLTVRVDLFTKDGNPLVASLNGVSQSTFNSITIPAGGVVTLAPLDPNGDDGF